MQNIDIHVATIPIGIDKDVTDTVAQVFREWRKTDHGKLVTGLSHEVFCELADAPEHQGMIVNIIAQIPMEDAVAYKLMKTGVDDE